MVDNHVVVDLNASRSARRYQKDEIDRFHLLCRHQCRQISRCLKPGSCRRTRGSATNERIHHLRYTCNLPFRLCHNKPVLAVFPRVAVKIKKLYEPVNIGKSNILIVLRVSNALGYGLGPLLFGKMGQPTPLGHDVKVTGYSSLVVKDEVICREVSILFSSPMIKHQKMASKAHHPVHRHQSIFLLVKEPGRQHMNLRLQKRVCRDQ